MLINQRKNAWNFVPGAVCCSLALCLFNFPIKHFRMGQYRTYMFCISGVPTDLQSDPHNGPMYGEILGRYQADIHISVEWYQVDIIPILDQYRCYIGLILFNPLVGIVDAGPMSDPNVFYINLIYFYQHWIIFCKILSAK